MKLLRVDFTTNADKMGDTDFHQLRKEKNVALYRRHTLTGALVGFEVFQVKTVPAGTLLPNGVTVQENYESYPRSKSFGKTAWFIFGPDAESRANLRFEKLLTESVTEMAEEVEA